MSWLNLAITVVIVYIVLLLIGFAMYFYNACQTDQPAWEFRSSKDAAVFYLIVVPFVIGPALLTLEFCGLLFILSQRLKANIPWDY